MSQPLRNSLANTDSYVPIGGITRAAGETLIVSMANETAVTATLEIVILPSNDIAPTSSQLPRLETRVTLFLLVRI